MALPTSGSVWKYAKYLVRGAEYVIPPAVAYVESLLDHHESADPITWMRWNTIYNKVTPSGTFEDKAQFKVDLLNITSGSIDSTWTSGDFSTVQALFNTWHSAVVGRISASFSHVQDRAYKMQFNPDDPGPGHREKGAWAFADSGPPVYVNAPTPVFGSATAGLPYQVAPSVTFRTAIPNHWGRAYMPTPGTNHVDTSGRLTSVYRTDIANAWFALLDDLADANFLAVIPVTDMNKTAFHGLLGVTQVVVDDIPDIQRRRRPRQAVSRTVGA